MKTHTREEKEEAKKKLPKPISSFVGSESLSNIYLGIMGKLKLNMRQLMVMCEISNLILMGLEDEHSTEANLHQYLPELSNADMRELVADLNDRVFKEAQRRLRENIVEFDPLALIREKTEETKESHTTVLAQGKTTEEEFAEPQEVVPSHPIVVPAVVATPEVITPAGMTISVEKLSTPTITKITQKTVHLPQNGIQQIAVSQSSEKKTYKGVDPYREPVE